MPEATDQQAILDSMRALATEPMPDATPGRLRLAVLSEVALDASGNARPVHLIRTGTFTDMNGREATFTADHLRSIVANYGQRPNPPITERHDWGRAVGRMDKVYTDSDGENLYGVPRWNSVGKQLLRDEVYDGYSCELDPDGTGGWIKIGGSLTNYPAVNGLEPVRLSAPVALAMPAYEAAIAACQACAQACMDGSRLLLAMPDAPTALIECLIRCASTCAQTEEALERGDTSLCGQCCWTCQASADTCLPHGADLALCVDTCRACASACQALCPTDPSYMENNRMSEETLPTPAPAVAPPPAAVVADVAPELSALIAQLTRGVGQQSTEQMTALFSAEIERQFKFATQQAEAAAARKFAEFQAQRDVLAFAQDATSATVRRPYGLPLDTQRLATFLTGLNGDQRKEAQALLTQIVDTGLLSFEEIGSEGAGKDEEDPIEAYRAALAKELSVNPAQSLALQSLQSKHPAIVAAYNVARSKGGR